MTLETDKLVTAPGGFARRTPLRAYWLDQSWPPPVCAARRAKEYFRAGQKLLRNITGRVFSNIWERQEVNGSECMSRSKAARHRLMIGLIKWFVNVRLIFNNSISCVQITLFL
jgi:hypothetical protein